MNTNKKEILEKAIKVFSIRIFGYIFGFLFVWILSNKYGAKNQGIFSISFLFLSVGSMVAKLGVETSLVKWIANSSSFSMKKDAYLKSIYLVLISSSIISVILFVLSPFIALMYDKPLIENSLKIAAITIPFFCVIDVSGSYFKGEKKTTTYSLYVQLLKFFVPFVVILSFFFFSFGFIEVPILSYFFGIFIVSIIIVCHLKTILYKEKRKKVSFYSYKIMISESYPMMVSSAIVMIMSWSDIFILGFYVSEEKIGMYNVAVKLATLVAFVYNAVSTILTPKIAGFYNKNQIDTLKETINFSAKLMIICGLPIFLILFLFPEFFLSFFGEEYLKAKSVLRILLIAQFVNVLTGSVGPIMQMTGNQKKLQNLIIISLICNLVFSSILVNFYGMVGVAVASAFGMILWNLLGAKYIYKNLQIRTWWKFN